MLNNESTQWEVRKGNQNLYIIKREVKVTFKIPELCVPI